MQSMMQIMVLITEQEALCLQDDLEIKKNNVLLKALSQRRLRQMVKIYVSIIMEAPMMLRTQHQQKKEGIKIITV